MAENDDIADRPPDPFIRDQGAPRAGNDVTLTGLLGDSDRAGRRRLYLTTRLDYYVEFRTDEVLGVEDVAPDEPPFPGLDATRVTLPPDAAVDWVRRTTGADPFLLEASDEIVLPESVNTWQAECPGVTRPFGHTDFLKCPDGGPPGGGGTFGPWPTRAGHTCATCNQDSCNTCGENTCLTCWGGTCATCNQETCGCTQGTCATCGRFTCDRGCVATAATCVSCAGTCDQTCASCWNTCEGTCVSCAGTCDATCANTCGDTCANTCWSTCWATCESCATCNFFTCGTCQTDPGWCFVNG